ncbi:hypothetical protein EYR40_003039 [Pleurotus pulmonarius]|nr:hypothetical protein EYR36_005488 [Pleurotus pulmonarius]KAF4580641.1 hypothetical protein EYR40_003039 [Pleurotus pulmonarius]
MYRELSFNAMDSASNLIPDRRRFIRTLEKLALSAESNPNLQFTTSLYFFSFNYEGNQLVPRILPFLINLQRLAINSFFFHPDCLVLLPPTAKLTHLILMNIKYSSFVNIIKSHPTLRTISVQTHFRSHDESAPEQSYDIATAFPQLRSLTCPIDSAHRFGHRPSVTDVCFTSWLLHGQPIPEQIKDQVVEGFPLARAANFPDPFDFPGIASLACRLSSLEYLLLGKPQFAGIFKDFFDWNLLSATKLKYIRVFISTSEDVAHAIFAAVQSVALVDVVDDIDGCVRRSHRHSEAGVPVDIYASVWRPWWECVKKDVDYACLGNVGHEH